MRAYEILRDSKNTSASIGWYNQSLASGASKAHGSIIHSKNQVKRKFSGDQRDHPKMTKLVENPSVVGWNVKSKHEKPLLNHALDSDFS